MPASTQSVAAMRWAVQNTFSEATPKSGRESLHASEQVMQWFVEKQVEEEATMQDLLNVAERTREIPMLLEEYLARDKPGCSDA